MLGPALVVGAYHDVRLGVDHDDVRGALGAEEHVHLVRRGVRLDVVLARGVELDVGRALVERDARLDVLEVDHDVRPDVDHDEVRGALDAVEHVDLARRNADAARAVPDGSSGASPRGSCRAHSHLQAGWAHWRPCH